MIAISVSEQSQIGEGRRAALGLAQKAGFGESDAGRVALVATELSTNLLKHGGGGRLLAALSDAPMKNGPVPVTVDLYALDKGGGIADANEALRDGYSTAGSAGKGLGAIRRVSDEFHFYSVTGQGTAIAARIAPRDRKMDAIGSEAPRRPVSAQWGAICVPMTGEPVSGDDWQVLDRRLSGASLVRTVIVVDGLGHGALAAEAAASARALFQKNGELPLAELMERLHLGLRSTRGAAISIARFDTEKPILDYCGIGNVSGYLVSSETGRMQRLLSHNGTAGHIARHIRSIGYSYPKEERPPFIILHSDGLSTSWSFERLPGLQRSHPSVIAAVLFRDFGRGRDDATVVVAEAPSNAC